MLLAIITLIENVLFYEYKYRYMRSKYLLNFKGNIVLLILYTISFLQVRWDK